MRRTVVPHNGACRWRRPDARRGTTLNDERELLLSLIRGPASGDQLARAGGQTRAAIWKRIRALRDAGVPIEARAGQGYRLAGPLDLLDAAAIRACMDDRGRDTRVDVEVLWTVDSTNSELLRRPAPAHGTTRVLLAERQTGGRGRRGRPWASPLAAHLYMSLVRGFDGGLARLGGLSLVTGIAVVEALHVLGVGQAGLKWPNDVVVESGGVLHKLGGLLVEGGGEHAGPVRAVVGLGLNVRMPAVQGAELDQPWTDLASLLGAGVDRNRVAAVVLDHVLPALAQFDADGLAPFLQRYAALDVLAGRDVMLHDAQGGCREAQVQGLAADGALRVRLGDGRSEDLYSGEVSVRRRTMA